MFITVPTVIHHNISIVSKKKWQIFPAQKRASPQFDDFWKQKLNFRPCVDFILNMTEPIDSILGI